MVVTSCGFKSHLPHERLKSKDLSLFALSGKLLFFLKWEFSLKIAIDVESLVIEVMVLELSN